MEKEVIVGMDHISTNRGFLQLNEEGNILHHRQEAVQEEEIVIPERCEVVVQTRPSDVDEGASLYSNFRWATSKSAVNLP